MKKKLPLKKKVPIIIVLCILLVVTVVEGFSLMNKRVSVNEPTRIFIPDGCDYTALLDTLNTHHCIHHSHTAFHTIARLRGLPNHIKPGSYLLKPDMSVFSLVMKLYSGNQDPIRVTINKHRTLDHLCQFLGSKLMFHPDTLLALLTNDDFCAQYGLTPQTIISLFTRNTYEFYWTITPQKLVYRMSKEYELFWKSRDAQLQPLGLSRTEVITLASIVEEETNCNDEKDDIASVYLNRCRIGMPLQADPTVKFALGDFSIRRIKGAMLAVESPYNTYRNPGLPPGPICIPSAVSIDAVLHNKKTDYLFFCAKEDFSGHHNFAATSAEHMRNAQKFHKALNERNIH